MLKAVYFEILEYASENLEYLRRNLDVITLRTPDELTTEILDSIDVLFAPLGYKFDAALLAK